MTDSETAPVEVESEDPPRREPVYPQTLHSEVVGECREWWGKGRPWTKLRVLRGGVDSSEGASCGGSQGEFGTTCPRKVEAVQYTTCFGDPLFYCEEHALKQADWDVLLYDSAPKERPPLTAEEEAFIKKLLTKKRRKDEETTDVEDPE